MECLLFEKFNGPARRAVQLAFREARRRQHDFLGTEHLLFGLLCDHTGPAAAVLRELSQPPEEIQARLEEVLHDEAAGAALDQFPLSPAVQRALDYTVDESAGLGLAVVGPEHLLLGLLRETDTQAALVLAPYGVGAEEVRRILRERPASDKPEFLLQNGARPRPGGSEPSPLELRAMIAPIVPDAHESEDEPAGTPDDGALETPNIAAPVLADSLRHGAAVEKQLRRTQLALGAFLGFYFGQTIGGWQLGLLAALGGICLALLHSSFAGAWMGFMAGFIFLPGFLQDGEDRINLKVRFLLGAVGALLGSFLGDVWRRPRTSAPDRSPTRD
jgi:hypothetical protein